MTDTMTARYVYVVTANEDERVKNQEVYDSLELALARFKAWKVTYGGANVCMASRAVLSEIPPRPNLEPEPKPYRGHENLSWWRHG